MSEVTHNEYQISDEGSLRRYRTEIPNIVFCIGLNAYELALYVHIKRTAGAGNGECYKSGKRLAEESGISTGKVSEAKQALLKPRDELGGLPLIRIESKPNKDGGKERHVITVTDIWPANFSYFAAPKSNATSSYSEVTSSPDELASSPHEVASSPGEIKNKPFKKEPNKNDVPSTDVDALYAAYPKHVGKGAALKAVVKAVQRIARGGARPDGEAGEWPPPNPVEFLMERVKSYAKSQEGKDPQFTKHPATWFNQECYLDAPESKQESLSSQPLMDNFAMLDAIAAKYRDQPTIH